MFMIGFWDFMSMARPHWRGQTSLLKSMFFLFLGTPDIHTRLRNSYVLNQIEHLPLPVNCSVLDAGCGRAVSLFWLARRHPDWSLFGIELDPVMARSAQQAAERGGFANMTIVEDNIQELEKKDVFDLILSIDTLEHIPDDVGLLRRFRKALKPGGHLVLHVPRYHKEMWRWLPVFRRHGVHGHVRDKTTGGERHQVFIEGHVRDEYTKEELRLVAENAGFSVLDLRETIGRWGEISFELNNLLWPWPTWRYLLSVLTYPIAIPIGYLDVLQSPTKGNSLMLTAIKE